MCDVYRKAGFSPKNVYKRAKHGGRTDRFMPFPGAIMQSKTQSHKKFELGLNWGWVEKTIHEVETCWLSSKEKVLGRGTVRKVGLIVFWNMTKVSL